MMHVYGSDREHGWGGCGHGGCGCTVVAPMMTTRIAASCWHKVELCLWGERDLQEATEHVVGRVIAPMTAKFAPRGRCALLLLCMHACMLHKWYIYSNASTCARVHHLCCTCMHACMLHEWYTYSSACTFTCIDNLMHAG